MEIRKNKDGTLSFKEKVYLPDGSTKTRCFKRKTDAISWKNFTQLEVQRNEALGVLPLKENLTFFEIHQLWVDRKIRPHRSLKTLGDYISVSKNHLLPLFGAVPIRSISRSHGDDLVIHIKNKGLAPKSGNKAIALLRQIMIYAESENYIAKSPFKNLPMLKENPGRIDFLTTNEILQVCRNNASEPIYPILIIALNTGMRIGEITGLCWDRVNFSNEIIEVSRTLTRSGLKDTTKTNLIRYIPMNEEVKNVLWLQFKTQQSPKFVFVNAQSNPYNPDHFSKRYFEKALLNAGVRKINFHILRHTYASQFMMNGGNIFDLQKILGHTKVDMTMKYAHLSPHHLRQVVDTVRYSSAGNMSNSPFVAPRVIPIACAEGANV